VLRDLLLSLVGCGVLALTVFVFYVRHKKQSSADLILIGRRGRVTEPLDPEGAVIVDGELWRAVTHDGASLVAGHQVRVCGAQGHLLIVKAT
jgi:membrane-bound serine protease (ClpP class)